MRCSDGHFYVVKFRNNPKHLRVLANEMFASRLAHSVGLPVPEGEVVEVNDWVIEHTSELSSTGAQYDSMPSGTPVWIEVRG